MMISIVISTISARIEKLVIPQASNIEYVVVHQNPHEAKQSIIHELLSRKDVVYTPLYEHGLTKSRNVGIANASGDYVLIMDDDVTFSIEKIYQLIKTMIDEEIYVATYYHQYLDGRTTKINNKSYYLNKLTVAQPSSIDICFNKRVLAEKNIKFDELFGLGSKYPSGEEMIFLSDCLSSGLPVKRYPLEICVHPPITSGLDFYSSPQKIAAKAAMFSRVYKKWWRVMFILFVIKKIPRVFKAGYTSFFISNVLDCLRGKY